MERCPCCNAYRRDAYICPRCKADLSALLNTENSASYWLNSAIKQWQAQQYEQSIHALLLSISLKKIPLALSFYHFIIEQQSQIIINLLSDKHYDKAEKRLYMLRALIPNSPLLQNLKAFSAYLNYAH